MIRDLVLRCLLDALDLLREYDGIAPPSWLRRLALRLLDRAVVAVDAGRGDCDLDSLLSTLHPGARDTVELEAALDELTRETGVDYRPLLALARRAEGDRPS